MYYGYYYEVDNNFTLARNATSILNRRLNEVALGQFRLPPRSYLAVVREPTWLTLGVEDAEHEASYTVVFGRF
jgi:hypothetical protein